MNHLNADQFKAKLAAIANALDGTATAQLESYPYYIEHYSLRLKFEPTTKIRDKDRHICKWDVFDGQEWVSLNHRLDSMWPQIKLTKSARAIANDLQRRILPDARKDVVTQQRSRQAVDAENSLAQMTLINCRNAGGERNLRVEDRHGIPRLIGTIDGAKVEGDCTWRKPNRVNLRLENLTQFTAERVLAAVAFHQRNNNADNI